MKYPGSKNRVASEILPIILAGRKKGQHWVEPFAGGFNLADKVENPRLLNEKNPFIVAMFKAVLSGWTPPNTLSESEYLHIRENKHAHPAHLVGFAGVGCAYSGKWFGGYARGEGRNYAAESQRNVLKQALKLQGAELKTGCYTALLIPPKSLIYADPPYEGTYNYGAKFDSEAFWQWCRERHYEGHDIFVSEYKAPEDFICIWQKEINVNVNVKKGDRATEKLFTYL